MILAVGLLRLVKNRGNERSRHYCSLDHWRHISLFSGVGVIEGKNVPSQTIVKNRWENRVILLELVDPSHTTKPNMADARKGGSTRAAFIFFALFYGLTVMVVCLVVAPTLADKVTVVMACTADVDIGTSTTETPCPT